MKDVAPVTTPITTEGYQMDTRRSAKLSPITSASKLVATERTTSITPLLGS
jgi:hypothetical protein